jgi:hypothetical protein
MRSCARSKQTRCGRWCPQRISASQIGIPEAISDGSSNITMHQVLRLLYEDQLTPVQRIFRAENFDTWQARQAVGDRNLGLMCGIGGYDLFAFVKGCYRVLL